MSDKKIAAIIIGVSTLILVGGVLLTSKAPKLPQLTASEVAKLEVDEFIHDWGTISLNGGNVNKTFRIKNSGTGTLQLANLKTSCMCTEARVIINDQKSPFFGMHSNSSWLGELKPGQEAEVQVVFDPAYHGQSGIGQMTRIVSIETNDQNNRNLEFKLTANVVN